MNWVTNGWFSDLLRPRLDDVSLLMYKASMYNVVSGRSTFELDTVSDYVDCIVNIVSIGYQKEILEWVMKNMRKNRKDWIQYELWMKIMRIAVKHGHLEYVKTICEFDTGFPKYFKLEDIATFAVKSKNRTSSTALVEILEWAWDFGYDLTKLQLCYDAAIGGNIECLKFVHERGCRLIGHFRYQSTVVSCASYEGNLECLRYAHVNGFALSEDAIHVAAIHRHLDCYLYLRQNGVVLNENVLNIALENGWPEPRDG